MIGGYRIIQHQQGAGALDIMAQLRSRDVGFQEGRAPDEAVLAVPRIGAGIRHCDLAPGGRAVKGMVAIFRRQHGHVRALQGRIDLGLAGPDIRQPHGRAIGSRSQGLMSQIDPDSARQRISHDQRRRHEI
ncbi:MAG: hypothetical protein WDN03_08235 [Rhizomicrobium sp.]